MEIDREGRMVTFQCPSCGLRMCIAPEEKKAMREFGFSRTWQAEIVQPTLQTAEKAQSPALLLRFINLPLWQSLISGLLSALILTGISILIARWAEWKLTIWDFALTYVIFAILVWVGVWWVLFAMDRITLLLNEIIKVLEWIFGKDINKDGAIGQPEPAAVRKAEPFEVVWTDPKNRTVEIHPDWPISETQIREVGKAVLGGVALSKRELSRYTSLGPDKALEVLSFMRRRAYAHYVDGNTTELTGRGEHFFSKLLSD